MKGFRCGIGRSGVLLGSLVTCTPRSRMAACPLMSRAAEMLLGGAGRFNPVERDAGPEASPVDVA
jgi:hypothetical protein